MKSIISTKHKQCITVCTTSSGVASIQQLCGFLSQLISAARSLQWNWNIQNQCIAWSLNFHFFIFGGFWCH